MNAPEAACGSKVSSKLDGVYHIIMPVVKEVAWKSDL